VLLDTRKIRSDRKKTDINPSTYLCLFSRQGVSDQQSELRERSKELWGEVCNGTGCFALLWDQSSVRQTETSRREGKYVVWTSFQYQGFGKVRVVQLHAYKKLQAWQRVQKLCNL
jgi:hypothetical protein